MFRSTRAQLRVSGDTSKLRLGLVDFDARRNSSSSVGVSSSLESDSGELGRLNMEASELEQEGDLGMLEPCSCGGSKWYKRRGDIWEA